MITPSLEALKNEVTKAGFKVSSGSYEDDLSIYAFSVETVPGTCGHPHFEASFSKTTGWANVGKQWFKAAAGCEII